MEGSKARMLTPMSLAEETMTLPRQAILPGLLESAYRRELQYLSVNNAIARLWAKDPSLWPMEEYQAESVKGNLRWLDLPDQLEPLLARGAACAAKIESASLEEMVVAALGG